MQTHNPDDGKLGILTKDRVHLNNDGNRLVAEELLKIM